MQEIIPQRGLAQGTFKLTARKVFSQRGFAQKVIPQRGFAQGTFKLTAQGIIPLLRSSAMASAKVEPRRAKTSSVGSFFICKLAKSPALSTQE